MLFGFFQIPKNILCHKATGTISLWFKAFVISLLGLDRFKILNLLLVLE